MTLDFLHERMLRLDLPDLLRHVQAAIVAPREKVGNDRMMCRDLVEQDLIIRSKGGV